MPLDLKDSCGKTSAFSGALRSLLSRSLAESGLSWGGDQQPYRVWNPSMCGARATGKWSLGHHQKSREIVQFYCCGTFTMGIMPVQLPFI